MSARTIRSFITSTMSLAATIATVILALTGAVFAAPV